MTLKLARRVTQGSVLFLIFLIPFLRLREIDFVSGTLYSLSVGPLWISDPLSSLQVALITGTIETVLLASMIVPVLLALVFGRVFCSWCCPQNTVSEIADAVRRKIGITPLFKAKPSAIAGFAVLGVLLVGAVVLRFPAANLFSAPGIISLQATRIVYEGGPGIELGLISVILAGEVLLFRRGWCKFICPTGALLRVFRTKRTMKVKFSEDGERFCGKCLRCAEICGLGLDPMHGGSESPLCHNCGDCISACKGTMGTRSPLFWKF